MDKTRMQQYMSQMRAMFNKHALYSDESPQYQIPFEPNPGDTVKIRFRTLTNNVDAVYFISGSTRAQMQVGSVRNGFDYYEIEIPVGNQFVIFLKFRQAVSSVITINSVLQENCRRCTLLVLFPAFVRQTGRRARSCIRFSWIVSAMATRPMMC